MPWWGWLIVAIWGPGVVFTAVMIAAVLIEKGRERWGRREPVTVDRRRPENAMLRAVAGPRHQRQAVLGYQRNPHLAQHGAGEPEHASSGSATAGMRTAASRMSAR